MPTPIDRADSGFRLSAIAAARLRSEGNNQKAIASRLGVSQPEVSRLLAYAVEKRFLAAAPSFLSQNLAPGEKDEMERHFFVNVELRDHLARLAPQGLHLNVQVLPEGDDDFATAAAGCVARLLHRSRLAGVMWGRTLRRIVVRIGEHREILEEGRGSQTQCIPLCGDPVHLMNLGQTMFSASHLASELNNAIRPDPEGKASNQPCLIGVPAYLSRRISQRRGGANLTWEDFVQEIPGYRAIFGANGYKEGPWVDRVDTILTGMGIVVTEAQRAGRLAAGRPTAEYQEMADFIRERVIQEDGITESLLARLVLGDIGGWLIEKPGLKPSHGKLVRSLNLGWTGAKDSHFANVARNARPDGFPGVILVAAGRAKASMLRELVKRGLINEILVDTSLADAIL